MMPTENLVVGKNGYTGIGANESAGQTGDLDHRRKGGVAFVGNQLPEPLPLYLVVGCDEV